MRKQIDSKAAAADEALTPMERYRKNFRTLEWKIALAVLMILGIVWLLIQNVSQYQYFLELQANDELKRTGISVVLEAVMLLLWIVYLIRSFIQLLRVKKNIDELIH